MCTKCTHQTQRQVKYNELKAIHTYYSRQDLDKAQVTVQILKHSNQMSQVFAQPRFIPRSSASSFVSIYYYGYCLTCNWLLFAEVVIKYPLCTKKNCLSLGTATTILVLRGTRLMGSWRDLYLKTVSSFNLAFTYNHFRYQKDHEIFANNFPFITTSSKLHKIWSA